MFLIQLTFLFPQLSTEVDNYNGDFVLPIHAESGIDGVEQWSMLSEGGPSKRVEFVYNIDTAMNSTAIRFVTMLLLFMFSD